MVNLKQLLVVIIAAIVFGCGACCTNARADEAPPADMLEQAKATFRSREKGPQRVAAAKLLYAQVKIGMEGSAVATLLGGPDSSKGGRPNLFWDYSVGERQEIE